ncbi:hypothetical protein VNO78_21827 [Psophocarpus tetragonolobus]|uniref:Uncharacterized protein n=1 Tax=Psophocarpus tetragonolobus TaxID=3891 RepID=A0AAN9XIH1_PSOTE
MGKEGRTIVEMLEGEGRATVKVEGTKGGERIEKDVRDERVERDVRTKGMGRNLAFINPAKAEHPTIARPS